MKSQRAFYMEDEKYQRVRKFLESNFDIVFETVSQVVDKAFDFIIAREGLNEE